MKLTFQQLRIFVLGGAMASLTLISQAAPNSRMVSPKVVTKQGNPLLDFHFTADPTAVEYEDRLYVFATNDHEQYEAVGPEGKNSYEQIKSLVMMSSDDMVNWTYHGEINVGELAPWIIASWAPSVTKREEADGLTHFYLYFSNSGYGTGVLESTHPLGPWRSPLAKSLIDADTPGLGECKVPFDPGVTIDSDGTGWLAVGAGNAVIMRLGDDMISIDGEIVPLPTSHHFEANELNFINGTYIYTYNNDWTDHEDWPYPGDIPPRCSMCYMTTKTPLDVDSWKYGRHYLNNSGDYGFEYTNNHTHLHKYKGNWYILYHSMELQKSFGTHGGFRNVCVDRITVDEKNPDIFMASQTLEGVEQIQPLNPFQLQQAETTAATYGVGFVTSDDGVAGNMLAMPLVDGGYTKLRGVSLPDSECRCRIAASGKGKIEIHRDSVDGEIVGFIDIDSNQMGNHEISIAPISGGVSDLYFVMSGENIKFDSWQFI